MRRLVWAFAGRIYHIFWNLMPRLKFILKKMCLNSLKAGCFFPTFVMWGKAWVQTVCKNYQQRSLACTPVDNAPECVRQYIDRRVARLRPGSWASTLYGPRSEKPWLCYLRTTKAQTCLQQRRRHACAYTQSDQHLCYSLSEKKCN